MKTSNRSRRRAGMTLGNVLIVMLLVFSAVMTVTQFSASTMQNAFKGRDDSMTAALSGAGVTEIAGWEQSAATRPDSLLENARAQARNQWDAVVKRFHTSDSH